MSLDNRNTSAQYKRAEQLKRWEESEMNKKLSGVPKSPSSRRIKFSSGCIFLAACVAGDKEEVEWLLKNGADIDTANVDGLTALHQACIDDNLDMVEFLVQKGADVNRKDNEGWTPLHATASCGFLSIARYLIENGADLASINSDGELAVDLANSDAMEDLIQHHLDEQGIDCEEARQAEERIMLSDATKWLRTDSPDCDKAHPKTGATAIHVAAAKGYIGVLKLLLEGRGDIDRQDVDGWTPLHAAAYWGQKEATQMLLNASADIDVQNYSGQLAIDIAQDDIVPLLKDARKNGKRTKRRPPSHGNRITDNFENSTETPTKVIRVEVKPIDSNKEKEVVSEKENKPTEPDVILRRTQSFESDEKFYQRYAELRARIQANSCPHTILPSTPINTKTSTASNNNNNSSNNNNNNNNNSTTNNSSGTTTTPASNISSYLVQRSASLKDHRTLRKTTSNLVLGSTTTSPSSATGPASGATTNLVPPAATGTGAANNTTGSTTGSSGAVSPPTSPSGTPTTTPTAGQIRSSIPTPITLNSHKNTTMSNNTDNSSSTTTTTTPFGDRYRKRYEDQPETVRKPSATNSTVANDHTSSTTTTSAPEAADHTAHETTLTPATGPETNKNHSLFELNRKYIEQAQKTKINNERNKFLSSLNEKRQQQLQEQQQQEQQQQRRQQPAEQPRGGGRYDGRPGKPEASQEEASFEEPAAVKLIMPSYTAAPVPAAVLEQQPPAGTTPVTTSPSSNKLSPGNIFKNFFKSFVPPTRDEESETQRKAHAKRVRETRRSTQGVTLDEIKSAEQLVKKKNATGSGNENDTMAPATATATTTTTTPSSPSSLSSTASPSFTNDRVPAVGSTGDQQQQQGSNHVTEGSAAQDAAGGGVGGGSTKVEEIAVSASFTLAAPGSSLDDGGDGGGGGGGGGGHRRHRRSVAGMDEEEDDSKVTVSYTISAPVRQSSPSPRAVAAAAAAVSNSKESADPLDGTGAGDVPAVTATFHVPATASEPMVATSATIRTSSGAAGGVVSNSDSNTTTTNTSNSNNNNTSASFNTNHNTAATTTTYTKRSLFDIDNANSLTLAEKLRHEANKYAIAAVADGDLDSHLVARVPGSNSGTTNSGGGDESNSTSTNAPADNSAASAGAAVPPSPTLRKADPATTTTTGVTAERRPSWRLKVDGGSKFKLEDASTPNAATQSSSVASSGSVYEPSGPANQAPEHGLTTTKLTSSSALAQRRAQQQNGDSSTATTGTTSSNVASSRPLSAPASGLAAGEQYNRVPGSAATAAGEQQTVAAATDPNSPLHHLRRPPKSAGEENKENDKENDSRSTAQATQAVIQRRRRQKRRSTGVVSVGMEDLDPDRQDSPVDGDEKETGSERGRSRVGSTASELDTANQPQDSTRENGGDCIDYKALYEQEKADNDKLKMALRKKDEEVVTLKAALDRFTTATTKNNSLSELEKRERRAMERKMSEMEEELKLLQKYKTENERLRAENRALTRVVSKLTTSAQNQIHASKQ
ncbi:protein phosphatase 1 regulatory subunit 12A isoform X10 [Anopheles merus]|uniref:protein phosphatase 1 regulatory subunit 12A isoform X10 n=1 Tax=Anopheles merus TaxID=30066 RepID=UPI001BE45C91|nr:protein phosphatase 1 regulatory subunit 12A isoform X10 [Anopheles merus]